ncbi:trypsin-like peptidase domain-containing protein [Patescibacteria group bacterium]|nr:trypsin-like peptidase domain-containing protein [Patescibacteria group bacterium]
MDRSRRIKITLLLIFVAILFVVTPWLIVLTVKKIPDVINRIKYEITRETKYDGPDTLKKTEVVFEESKIVDVVERVSPSVVSVVVKTVSFDFFSGPSLSEEGIGTGFIVDKNGLIVTNSHVVDDMTGEYSVITKDGTTYEVEKIHRDPSSDLAILEITARGLPEIELGDSDSLKVGQTAIAIGNALGRFQNTVTVGVISGIARQLKASSVFGESKLYENVIQTDAALNPGNSGGPLLNSSGQVIGINVATSFGADNISFAIPVNVLKPILETFITEGRIIKPYLGVTYTMITRGVASLRKIPEGAFINRVIPDSPASKSGLERGDIITKIDDEELGSEKSLLSIVGKKSVGDKIKLTVDRDREELVIYTTIEEMPENY